MVDFSPQPPSPLGLDGPSVGIGDLITTLKISNQNMSILIQTLRAIFPRVVGSFKLSAAVSTTIPQTGVNSSSVVSISPTNAAAGSRAIYVSAISPGVSFTVSTANGAAAAGTETYSYFVVNPS